MCHVILFAPVLALPVFWLLPATTAIPVYGVVVALTALVLWPVFVTFRRPPVTGREGMVGLRCETLTDLAPQGLVRCQGEVWSAHAEERFAAGEPVRVLSVSRLELRVGRYAGPTISRSPDGHCRG